VIDAPVSVSHLLEEGTRRLQTSGINHPSREAWWIWEKISGRPRAYHLTREAEPVADTLYTRYNSALSRRSMGEPLAHVLGEAAFRHLLLCSDGRALIPRPETEGLVDLVLERHRTGRVVDIGTGTGCIALSLASEGEYELVVAVEQSSAALELARSNVEHVGSPVRLIAGDLCRGLGDARFDVLVSNPPYLTDAEYTALSPEVRNWEPEAALRSGSDGLEATRRLVTDGLRVVKPGGWLMLELDCARASQAAEAAVEAGWSDVLVKDDLFGRARYLVARRSE
jgi:release factor glutamine methyltransferase